MSLRRLSRRAWRKAATDFNVDAQLVGPVGADAEKQVAEIESLIQKGVDGLAVSSVSTDALAPIIQRGSGPGNSGGDLQHRQPDAAIAWRSPDKIWLNQDESPGSFWPIPWAEKEM